MKESMVYYKGGENHQWKQTNRDFFKLIIQDELSDRVQVVEGASGRGCKW